MTTTPEQTTSTAPEDQFAWLEEVEGEEQLTWVRARNTEAEERLRTGRFESVSAEILEVLDSSEKIPAVVQRGEYLYNFWTDAAAERGIWRRTTWESYRTEQPEWEVLIDVDALAAAEDVNWVWHGAAVLKPAHNRALVSLSRGGADADITREFDLDTKTWVEGGFTREESKGGMSWADESGSAVFIYTDFGEGSMTTSGYPRTVRRWERGTALEDAPVVFEGKPTDMLVGAGRDQSAGFERDLVFRMRAFYDSETYLRAPDGTLTQLDLPRSAEPDLHREWLAVELREDWEVGGTTYPGGSMIAIALDAFLAGDRDFTVLFTPTDSTSLAGTTWTRHHLVLNVLSDVVNQLEVLTPPAPPAERGASGSVAGTREWQRRALDLGSLDVPAIATIAVGAIDSEESDALWLTTTGFVEPTTLSRLELSEGGEVVEVEALKALPAFFDASDMSVEQHFATSADGTQVPYFQVTGAGVDRTGPAPTLLYGYGGFEISLTPSYSAGVGRAWLARGGVYVLANIRGGGEYGPRWHQAALKEKRHKAYEDFAAVARDLVTRGVTTPERLGTQGGSNGGLLMGNMYAQYPDLFGAVVCQVPLLDMKRYNHLLAGASWMAEYGDPDEAEQWEFIQKFSPYHLIDAGLEAGGEYPPILFTTSTRDDRVHPGHARKMAAKLLEAGQDVTSYENIEGGHGGAATNAQRAFMNALAFEFLWQRLG
ncbi:prolyl oligopeptidase family serine peptidase [Bogoriella caseilytica]|uniref:Prolyl oligopeptidase n=1 Tax=Bogoriella caseilytica TaxID=56055 RepID=A0A3N2BBJ2_9MICO|nr:prolyl oligopeptidase family serine peptidase [Bogoriella caseilytica]ROR72598.1 prolyl oligopeptidase [Bogoriella caseilytica]